ncbi:MAG TPA: hypothetical protein VLC91_03160 [Spongiibacteraceae bacterium]|nr:hypothetical protein [Spongiibacteraceae bacterium]
MAKKADLPDWVAEAIKANGGSARLLEVAKYIWDKYEAELHRSGDLFYKWQYDMRWAANQLRNKGVMKPVSASPLGVWELL